jgi:hypothetical protein
MCNACSHAYVHFIHIQLHAANSNDANNNLQVLHAKGCIMCGDSLSESLRKFVHLRQNSVCKRMNEHPHRKLRLFRNKQKKMVISNDAHTVPVWQSSLTSGRRLYVHHVRRMCRSIASYYYVCTHIYATTYVLACSVCVYVCACVYVIA